MNIHYSTTTGEIVSWGTADYEDGQDSHLDGCKVLIVPLQTVHSNTHKVDPATRTVVALSPQEVQAKNALTTTQVAAAVRSELDNSDKYMQPDFPVDAETRAQWLAYRDALRKCSKNNPTAAQMLALIPKRPGGIDAMAAMRSRV